jgi:hypothetical protein
MHIASLEGSLNAASLSAEVSCGLRKNNVPHASVPAAIVDRCSTNSSSIESLNEAAREIGEIERFPMYCFSHMTFNAGDKAGFVLLTLY